MFITWKNLSGGELDTFEVQSKLDELEVEADTQDLKSGEFLITVQNETEAKKVLAVKELMDGTKIMALPHSRTSGSKCIIKCPNIKGKSEQDILKRIEKEGVTEVKAKGANGTFVLTLKADTPPPSIKIGALKVPTTPFIPRPLLCRQCFVFGHPSKVCRNKPACRKCGGYHPEGPCKKGAVCRNCGGSHLPTDHNCPVWKQELAINISMIENRISGKEAREKYYVENPEHIVPPKVSKTARKDHIIKTTKDKHKPSGIKRAGTPPTQTPLAKKAVPPTASVDLTDDNDPPEDPETAGLRDFLAKSNDDYQRALRAIYGTDDESETEKEPPKAKTTPASKKKQERKKKNKKA